MTKTENAKKSARRAQEKIAATLKAKMEAAMYDREVKEQQNKRDNDFMTTMENNTKARE